MQNPKLPEGLITEPIVRCRYMDPGYSGHASDVWLVETTLRDVVVRASRWSSVPDIDFWWGCWRLFGLDPTSGDTMEYAARILSGSTDVLCPRVLERKVLAGRQFLVVEHMPGSALTSFFTAPRSLLYGLGRWLAQVHTQAFDTFGTLDGSTRKPLREFHDAAVEVMEDLVERYWLAEPDIAAALPKLATDMQALPIPTQSSPVLVDMDPTQFLVDSGQITAVVDTEAYVLAPPALDFIALEYVLDQRTASAVADGYTSVRPLPILTEVRAPYRYLYRLLSIQGDVRLMEWMNHPTLF